MPDKIPPIFSKISIAFQKLKLLVVFSVTVAIDLVACIELDIWVLFVSNGKIHQLLGKILEEKGYEREKKHQLIYQRKNLMCTKQKSEMSLSNKLYKYNY